MSGQSVPKKIFVCKPTETVYNAAMVKFERDKLPITPGVYFFKDARGRVLYVGKASNLRNRTTSYFRKSNGLSPAKARLLHEATKLTWEKTDSEIEALLQEAHYIKKLQPRFNVLLRDDKTYVSVVITREEFPRVLPTRNISGDGIYYGPFTDARAVKETLRLLRRFFPYRTTCKPNSGRLCLDAHLGLCPGVCGGKISAREYRKNIRHIKDFFEGKKKKVLRELKAEWRVVKRKKDDVSIARAEKLRYHIDNLERVLEMQTVLSFGEKAEGDVEELGRVLGLTTAPARVEGYDISNIMGSLTTASMVVFTNGQTDKNEYRKFKIKTVRGANDFASMQEVLRRRFSGKHESWPTPDLVLIDGGRPQLSAAMEVWKELKLDIPLVALAKRLEELFVPGQLDPIVLPRTSGALHLVQRVRDEAHRFAVSYHKLLRRKKLVGR